MSAPSPTASRHSTSTALPSPDAGARAGVSLRRVAFTCLALFLTGPAVGGCSCEDERPYTPFTVATGQTQADDAPTTAAGPTNQPAQFLEAPADATTWSAFGRQLVAPSGSKFHWAALYGDPASAEARLLTWTLGPPASGGLWLHGLDGKPTRHLLRSPSFLPQGGDCRESTHFLPGTALTATLDIRRSCASRLLPGSPERALVLLDVARPEPFVFGLRLLATPEGESFDFSAESVDLDGDGQNDVVAHFRARRLSGSTEKTSEKDDEKIALHWLARPAGPSRQKDTPSQEFVKRTKALVVSAQRKAERASVPTAVDALRRLYTAVCAESAAPRVLDWEGAPLACGGMDEGLKQLTTAAVHAELGLGRPARALGELTRADWYGSSPLNDAQRAALTKVALAKVPSGPARKQGEFRPALVARPTAPSLPRLHFDDASTLWALGPEQRVSVVWPPAGGEGADSAEEQSPSAWDLEPAGPTGQKVLSVLPSCERPELQLVTGDGSGTPGTTLSLGLLAPRPGRCREAFGGGPLAARLVGWLDGVPHVAVAGQVVSPTEVRPTAASTTTSLGWLELGPNGAALWRDEPLHGDLECTTSRNGEHLACVVDGRVLVWQRPESVATQP